VIPNTLHFVYVGGRPFSFIHFLAVYTAWKVNRPDRIYFHHSEEPSGDWWEKARPFLYLRRVPPVTEVFGNPVHYPAHQADVIRLEALERFGGVYLDLDVVSLNPLAPLYSRDCVMGMEPGSGLCNAVILARPGAGFIRRWREAYRSFDCRRWNYHSVQLPWEMALQHPGDIHIEGSYAFFYPSHSDPVHRYLWGGRPALPERLERVAKNLLKLVWHALPGKSDPRRQAYYRCFHVLRGADWHLQRARRAYCLHLWEGLWGPRYLEAVSPQWLRRSGTHFAQLLRGVVDDSELRAMDRPGPLTGVQALAA
jgi:hypothetical protein